MQAALRGTNAAVVGVLLAALYHPIWSQTVRSGSDFGGVLLAFALIELWKWPPWLVVFVGAVAGQCLFR
jgi:chromate transporter